MRSMQPNTLVMNVLVKETNLPIAHKLSLDGGMNLCGMKKMKK